jgi:hypothetical protein
MARWDILDAIRRREAEPSPLRKDPPTKSNHASPSVVRGGSDASTSEVERPKHHPEVANSTLRERRTQHQDRGRTYSLRNSEMEAMADIGRLRTVDVQDLARFVYRGDQALMRQDLENLQAQALVEEKTVFHAHKSARKLVTLTGRGHRMVRKASGLPDGQRLYHGFVKPRELDHDADLYKVYQKAASELRQKGGRPLRVRLDFELKQEINRAKEAARKLSRAERAVLLRVVAEENGLRVEGSSIHLPDIQIEYETRDGRIERENLELLSQNYREEGMRTKTSAGFKIYARAGEANRIRRALNDTGLAREVLSV